MCRSSETYLVFNDELCGCALSVLAKCAVHDHLVHVLSVEHIVDLAPVSAVIPNAILYSHIPSVLYSQPIHIH